MTNFNAHEADGEEMLFVGGPLDGEVRKFVPQVRSYKPFGESQNYDRIDFLYPNSVSLFVWPGLSARDALARLVANYWPSEEVGA